MDDPRSSRTNWHDIFNRDTDVGSWDYKYEYAYGTCALLLHERPNHLRGLHSVSVHISIVAKCWHCCTASFAFASIASHEQEYTRPVKETASYVRVRKSVFRVAVQAVILNLSRPHYHVTPLEAQVQPPRKWPMRSRRPFRASDLRSKYSKAIQSSCYAAC